MNIYNVRSSYPRTAGGRCYIHRSDNVLAVDISDAIDHVKSKRPLAHIWTVAHKGQIGPEMITEDALIDIGGSE